MDRQTASIVLIGLGLTLGVVVAAGVFGAPLVASATDLADDESNGTETMTETEFHWGTVTHETDPETGETHVDVVVEESSDVSVSTTTEPDATDDHSDENELTDTETFPWGAVTYTDDSDTGAAHVDVIVDAEEAVSLSVTTVSDDGTESTSTAVVQADGEPGEDGEDGADGEVSTSVNVSQSTSTPLGDDSIDIDIDIDD